MDPATVGAIAVPLVGGVMKGIGTMFGMGSQREGARKAKEAINDGSGKAINALEQGQTGLAGFNPYIQPGTDAAGRLNQGGFNATQPTQPTLSNFNADSADPWLKKVSDYTMRKANEATQASAIAKGGMGGGLAKALANQSQDFANQYWKDANQAALEANNLNFNQGQTRYKNDVDWQGQMFNQDLDTSKLGLGALSGQQGLTQGYAKDKADVFYNTGADVAGIESGLAKSAASGFGALGDAGMDVMTGIGAGLTNNLSSDETDKLRKFISMWGG